MQPLVLLPLPQYRWLVVWPDPGRGDGRVGRLVGRVDWQGGRGAAGRCWGGVSSGCLCGRRRNNLLVSSLTAEDSLLAKPSPVFGSMPHLRRVMEMRRAATGGTQCMALSPP